MEEGTNIAKVIILENVANMAKKRQIEQGCKVDAQIVADLFDKLGYTADWQIFNSKDYFHPQSRDRLWMVLWLRPSLECSLACLTTRLRRPCRA